MSILKTIMSFQVFITNKVLTVNEIGSIEGGDKSIKKSRKLLKIRKLSKLRKSKNKKMSKSQNLAKLKKLLLKNRNLTNFGVIEAKSNFLIL